MAANPEPLHHSGAARVQDIDEPARDRDTCRKLAARRDDLAALQAVTVNLERGDRVAARVDSDQERVPSVVRERALRRDAVGLRARCGRSAVSARGVRACRRERAVRCAVVDEDAVAAQLVGLHPDDGSAPCVAVPAAVPVIGIGGLGAGECRNSRHEYEKCCMSHGSPFD